MLKRVELKQVQAMIEDSKPTETTAAVAPTSEVSKTSDVSGIQPADGPEALEKEPLVADPCSIDDFTKIDLRVARVVSASAVEGADKLVQLTLSLGGDLRRNVFAGIKSAYTPEQLIGRLVIVVANLAPRKMRFGVSEGMVCAAGGGGQEIFLLSPDSGAVPGQRVH